ncbi:hypothetical protein ACIGCM_20720 [Pseudomonas sp. NPDC078700]|uniref:hypothetical protein n=1 Tax=Pseudomonas sp. NPDC078700 TaxID=3364424 RepID=UPI0037C50E71
MMDVLEAAGVQPQDAVAQPKREELTAGESLVIKFFRKLKQQDQDVFLQALEAMTIDSGGG